jgi:periplasmic protein TonB
MSLDPESVPRQNLGSLQGCLVEGDPEQRARERRIRRKALITSVLVQASLLAAVILVPLFGKPARLVMAITTPIPPYRHVAARSQNTPRPTGEHRVCVVCFDSRPTNLTPTSRPGSNEPPDPLSDSAASGIPVADCPNSGCVGIGGTEGPRPPLVTEPPREKRRLVETHIDPAMLIHRVEPVYPALAKQIGRAGRVELRAIIATDGTIQSLQAVNGDPLFYQSALDAVRQWRYRPTVLNGQPVEIDTFITVIYNIDR